MKLTDQIAVVTGAAQGIGEGIALHLADEGAHVAILDLNEDAAGQVAERIRAKGRQAVALGVDVTSEESVSEAMDGVCARLGRLDLLVNNAGVLKSSFITDFAKRDWDFVLNVNLTGAFLCIKHAARHMVAQESGNIVVIGSRSGKKGGLWNHAYCASKFGVIGMVQCVALDLAPYGIRANVVCPGNALDTPLWQDLAVQYSKKLDKTPEEVIEHYRSRVPLKRGCAVEDIAQLVAFLASSEASYMTGQALNVTGGEIMH